MRFNHEECYVVASPRRPDGGGPADGKMTLTAPNKPPMLRRGGLAALGFTGPLNTSYFAV
jgi:hypothetical protein